MAKQSFLLSVVIYSLPVNIVSFSQYHNSYGWTSPCKYKHNHLKGTPSLPSLEINWLATLVLPQFQKPRVIQFYSWTKSKKKLDLGKAKMGVYFLFLVKWNITWTVLFGVEFKHFARLKMKCFYSFSDYEAL